MVDGRVSVAEAAQILGVHLQRVHQRIREGSLPAEKIGRQWVIDVRDVHRVSHHSAPGRPLSAKSAWDLLAVAHGELDRELSASARSRARSRLRNLLAHASSEALEDAAVILGHALGNRASRALLRGAPADLADLREDSRIHLSGVALPESNMAAGDVVEGYVAARDFEDLMEHFLLSPADASRANVILHVVPASQQPAARDLDEIVHSPLALAADLAEHDGVREKQESLRWVARLPGALND